jgi:hypothetical protein
MIKSSIYRWAAAPVIVAGLGAALMSAGAASAASDPSTTASVTIAQATSLTDNTAGITFTAPAILPGPATNNPQPVSLTLATNDPNGATVSVGAPSTYFNGVASGQSSHFLTSSLSESASSTGSPSTPLPTIAAPMTTDKTTSAGTVGLTDYWNLNVPDVAADTYSTTLIYAVAAN